MCRIFARHCPPLLEYQSTSSSPGCDLPVAHRNISSLAFECPRSVRIAAGGCCRRRSRAPFSSSRVVVCAAGSVCEWACRMHDAHQQHERRHGGGTAGWVELNCRPPHTYGNHTRETAAQWLNQPPSAPIGARLSQLVTCLKLNVNECAGVVGFFPHMRSLASPEH